MSSISVILNLSPQALASGELAGQAEMVATGERQLVRSATELLAFLSATRGPLDDAPEQDVAARVAATR